MKKCDKSCDVLAKFQCGYCKNDYREIYFCKQHYENSYCKKHHPKEVNTLKNDYKLKLFAVICPKASIKSNHYVAFLKTGLDDKAPWVYYRGKINISDKSE
jgi:uncharacterized UBP type Zn finger protein